jgi:hypothetical protein
VVYVWAICLHHPDVVFAGDREGGEEVGEDEEVADFGTEIAELEGDSFVFGADVDADERAEAGGVHMGEVSEVEDDALVGGEELEDRVVEKVTGARYKFAMAADVGSGAAVFDLYSDWGWGWGVGHGRLLLRCPFYRWD